jgi:poly(3-hydroxybutyrate) depolymerase
MKFIVAPLVLAIVMLANQEAAAMDDSLMLKKAGSHPMHYFVSLPQGWTKEKQWPLLVVIESADKEYRENAMRFVRARGKMPFVIVAPYNVNNSRSGRRDPAVFPYSSKDWDYIESVGDCKFNLDGLTAIAAEVKRNFNTEEKYYLTGFEAGAHTVWQMTFQHPERLKAAIPVAGNYNQNSCMTDNPFSADPSRKTIPIVGFAATKDSFYGPEGRVHFQWMNARKAAADHGFENVSEKIFPEKGHVPLPDEVLNYVNELYTNEKQRAK